MSNLRYIVGILLFLVGCKEEPSNVIDVTKADDATFRQAPKLPSPDDLPLQVSTPTPTPVACGPTPKEQNLLRITIGMTVAEARVALECELPSVQPIVNVRKSRFIRKLMPDGSEPVVNFGTVGNEQNDQIFVAFAGPVREEKVWGVTRVLRFDISDAPSVANVAAEIGKRFGITLRGPRGTSSEPMGSRVNPLIGSVGDTSYAYECTPSVMEHSGSIPEPLHYSLDCDKALRVKITPHERNPSLVKDVRFSLSDGRYASGQFAAYHAAVDKAFVDQRKVQEEQAADRPVPKL